MPATYARRTVLGSLASVSLGSAGCLGGNDYSDDATKTDSVVVENAADRSRVISLLVTRDGERLAGGRYRVPAHACVHLEREFEWGTYEIFGKLHRDADADEYWQSWTWKPRSCASRKYTDDDGYWTGTVAMRQSSLDFSHAECATDGPLDGDTRPVEAGRYRVGNVGESPTTASE